MPRVEQPFAVDGYVLTDLIGFGATGEVWRGRDETTHEPVAIKRLWEPATDGLVLRLRQDAAVVAEVAGPHTVRILEVAVLAGGEVVLVMQAAAGGSLASLLARRGRLHPSEVVTVLAPLAQALADLHRRGMVHGDLTPTNVLFTADGCPMLADTGLAAATGERIGDDVGYRDPALDAATPPTAAADCFGLAALGYAALTGVAPRNPSGVIEPIVGRAPWVPAQLAGVIEAALAADPALRPEIEAFGTAVLAACGAAPVRLTGPRRTTESATAAADTDGPAARGRSRRGVVIGVVGCVLGLSALAGVVSARLNPPSAAALQPAVAATASSPLRPAAAPAAAPSHQGWRRIVDRIEAARSRAFRAADVHLLADVYWRGHYVRTDKWGLQLLHQQGLRAAGFRQSVVRVKPLWETPDAAQLRVVDEIAPYRIVDRDGRVVASKPGRRQSYLLTLGYHAGRWWAQAVTVPES
jgi:hypothetical protein